MSTPPFAEAIRNLTLKITSILDRLAKGKRPPRVRKPKTPPPPTP